MPTIMKALASIARQNATTAQSNPSVPAPVPAPASAFSLPGAFSNIAAPAPSVTPQQPGLPFLPTAQPSGTPVNIPQMPQMPQMPYQFPPQQPQQPQQPQLAALASALGMPGGFQANLAAPAVPNGNLDPKVQQQLVLIQTLAAQGIPFDKITSIIALMGNQPAAPAMSTPSVPPPQQMPQPTSSYAAPWEAPRHDESRDTRNGYRDPVRSPKPRGRSRSRSPARGWDGRDGPANRDRGYNNYGQDSPQGGRGGRAGHDDRGRDNYRQRSPARGRGFTPEPEPDPQDKWVEYDTSLTNGHIKVLSRTLFVGGVTCSEAELRQIFSRYGKVQTCIVNKDKRHAFVKMFWRKDAVRAKEAMEHNRDHDLPLRVSRALPIRPLLTYHTTRN
jgi:protein NRD1